MHSDRTSAVTVGPGGLNLAPYARLICRGADFEAHYVQLMLVVERTLLPLRLAAAAFVRTPWDDGTSPHITEMVLDAIPIAIQQTHLILTSGQVLLPFVDAPHIASDGINCMDIAPDKEQWYTTLLVNQDASPFQDVY